MDLRKIAHWSVLFIIGVTIMSVIRTKGKYVSVRSKQGKRMKIRVGSTLSPLDRAADASIQRAVRDASKQHTMSGRPVSRYDVKRKSVYLEYPDGKIEYKS